MKKFLATALILLLPSIIFSQFQSREIKDRLTDEITFSFASFSSEKGALNERMYMTLNSNKEICFVTVEYNNMTYMNKQSTVEYRFDKEPMEKLQGKGDSTSLFLFTIEKGQYDKNFQVFLEQLLNHNTLILRTTSFTDKSVTVEFDISGLKEEFAKRDMKGTVLYDEYLSKIKK